MSTDATNNLAKESSAYSSDAAKKSVTESVPQFTESVAEYGATATDASIMDVAESASLSSGDTPSEPVKETTASSLYSTTQSLTEVPSSDASTQPVTEPTAVRYFREI